MIKALVLAAGRGERLQPLTRIWPKCLMPIHSRPLLEYWLCQLRNNYITDVLVNVHHHRIEVEKFLNRKHFRDWVRYAYEPTLLGTAGTLRRHATYFRGRKIILIHADNWCINDIDSFLHYHECARPHGTAMTMMTFRTDTPKSCGIVELDDQGIVTSFVEKPTNPTSNLANAAIYVLEECVLDEIVSESTVTDFSTDVIPLFVGRIATWENTGVYRDVGSLKQLLQAQTDPPSQQYCSTQDSWQRSFEKHPIHQVIAESVIEE